MVEQGLLHRILVLPDVLVHLLLPLDLLLICHLLVSSEAQLRVAAVNVGETNTLLSNWASLVDLLVVRNLEAFFNGAELPQSVVNTLVVNIALSLTVSLPVVEVSFVYLSIRLGLGSRDDRTIHPSAIVSHAVGLPEFSLSVRFTVLELALVAVAVREDLGALNDLPVLPDALDDAAVIVRHRSLAVWDHRALLLPTLRLHLARKHLAVLDLILDHLLHLRTVLSVLGVHIPLRLLLDLRGHLVPAVLRCHWRHAGLRLSGREWGNARTRQGARRFPIVCLLGCRLEAAVE